MNRFPFLFGGTFIEADDNPGTVDDLQFPFLFGGTFIEAGASGMVGLALLDFPSFSEGLSLRPELVHERAIPAPISLPFRRDFH